MKTLEAMYCIPEEEPVVQLFVPDGGQWGEVRCRGGRLEVELFTPADHASWVVDVDELIHVFGLAKTKLVETEI